MTDVLDIGTVWYTREDMTSAYQAVACTRCLHITFYSRPCQQWELHVCRCGNKEGVVLKDRHNGVTMNTINGRPPEVLSNDLFTI